MPLNLGLIFGIIAFLAWGTADFFAAVAVRKSGSFKTFLWSQTLGIFFFVLALVLFYEPIHFTWINLFLLVFLGILSVVSYLAFYKGLEVGEVAVVSPIASAWALVTVILSLIFLHESLNRIQIIAVSLLILGSVLISFHYHDLLQFKFKKTFVGVKYALVALFTWGVYFFLLSYLVKDWGWFMPIFSLKILSLLFLWSYAKKTQKDITFPKNIFIYLFLIGFLEVIAFLAYGSGLRVEMSSLIAPISAAFPMVTVILARIFLKEHWEPNQTLGIMMILTSLILLAL